MEAKEETKVEKQRDLTLEEAFQELEAMLEKLGDRDVDLEKSFAIYAEGSKLLKYCSEKLDKVEKKMLVLNEEGGLDEF